MKVPGASRECKFNIGDVVRQIVHVNNYENPICTIINVKWNKEFVIKHRHIGSKELKWCSNEESFELVTPKRQPSLFTMDKCTSMFGGEGW